MIHVGTVLYGFCGGAFGRDSYSDKRVEGVGTDWVVAREMESGEPVFAVGPHVLGFLAGYKEKHDHH